MEKNFKKILVLFSIMGMVLGCLASCSKDEESLLVGTWIDSNSHWRFSSDGSFYSWLEPVYYNSGDQYRKGCYYYNVDSRTLVISIVAVPNHNNAYTNSYYVQTLTSKSLVLIDLSYGDARSFTKE